MKQIEEAQDLLNQLKAQAEGNEDEPQTDAQDVQEEQQEDKQERTLAEKDEKDIQYSQEVRDNVKWSDINIAMDDGQLEGIIGYLYAYTLQRGRMPYDKLCDVCQEIGIDEDERPGKPRVSDIWKSAVRVLESTNYKTEGDYDLKIDNKVEVGTNKEYFLIQKMVGRPTNSEHRPYIQWGTDQGFRLIIDDGHEPPRIIVEPYDLEKKSAIKTDSPEYNEELATRVNDIYNEVNGKFADYMNSVHDQTLRRWFRRVVQQRDGIMFSASRGGLWFLTHDHHEFMMKVKKLFDAFREWNVQNYYHGHFIDIRYLPAIDSQDQRRWIKSDLERHITKKLDELKDNLIKKLAEKDDGSGAKRLERLKKSCLNASEAIDGFKNRYSKKLGIDIELTFTEKQKQEIQKVATDRFSRMKEIEDLEERGKVQNVKETIFQLIGVKEVETEKSGRSDNIIV